MPMPTRKTAINLYRYGIDCILSSWQIVWTRKSSTRWSYRRGCRFAVSPPSSAHPSKPSPAATSSCVARVCCASSVWSTRGCTGRRSGWPASAPNPTGSHNWARRWRGDPMSPTPTSCRGGPNWSVSSARRSARVGKARCCNSSPAPPRYSTSASSWYCTRSASRQPRSGPATVTNSAPSKPPRSSTTRPTRRCPVPSSPPPRTTSRCWTRSPTMAAPPRRTWPIGPDGRRPG
ncbi:hypothetical protein C1Y40_04303 [Mycobacterium talmoniae]|uniref:Uncharacterized protein n=1 Tax=Mycobacterium talmoniae TaxID=1858794 RepID=A0A2S8BFT5_9MYCO|nr:hypothetical protein C1Y40_04303 [Mycobacterium talmoniae]